MLKDLSFDTYTLKARLAPALLVVLPISTVVYLLHPDAKETWGIAWGLFVACGGTMLLSQFGRDMGKSKEFHLFELWGGKPTTYLLRHRSSKNKIHLNRVHSKISELIPLISLPTEDEEILNPTEADDKYDSVTKTLISMTRDNEKYSLLFKENINYGFRRNLWGMKPIGLFLALTGASYSAYTLINNLQLNTYSMSMLICSVINVTLLLAWLIWIKPKWVKIPAEAYAERLLEAIENL